MFTGLIQEVGTLTRITTTGSAARVTVECAMAPFAHGESIAINGACLTVDAFDDRSFGVFASPETLKITGLGSLRPGTGVNLERPIRLSDPLGGHLVSGHVDTRVALLERQTASGAARLSFAMPTETVLARQIAPKGSIALNGVSLTVNRVSDHAFDVMVIPVTLNHTNLGTLTPGDRVNLETDMLAKYVTRQLAKKENHKQGAGGVDLTTLLENGFVR